MFVVVVSETGVGVELVVVSPLVVTVGASLLVVVIGTGTGVYICLGNIVGV